MKTHILVVLIISASLTNAYASGNRVGNGGNVVSCPGKIQVLDLYESDQKIAGFSAELKHPEIIREVLKNLANSASSLAKQYERRSEEFLKETDFRADVELATIKDSKHLFVPSDKECKVQQIAIRKNIAGSSSRFVVNKNLWEKLSEKDKAALILHEVLYEHLFKLGEEDSVKARTVNAYLFSEAIKTDKKDKFWNLIRSLKLPIYQ